MVMALDVKPALHHGLHHLRPQSLVMIGGRHREIAFLVTWPVAEVGAFAAGVPAALFGVDEIIAGMLVLIETDVIKNEKFGFGSKICRVAHPGILQICFCFLGN